MTQEEKSIQLCGGLIHAIDIKNSWSYNTSIRRTSKIKNPPTRAG